MEKRLSAEEFIRQTAADPMKAPVERAMVAKVLKRLAPAFGFAPSEINRVWAACDGADLLQNVRLDQEIGRKLPAGLIIGGVRGVSYGDLLAEDITTKPFFKKFVGYAVEFGEAVWVITVKGSDYWVIHNTTVPPGRRLHSIEVYAQRAGMKHIQIIRINNYIKEFADERHCES